jgi:predicted dinucleotide-binding enzyme
MTAPVMVNPSLVNGGDHSVFLSGNSQEAKAKVGALLQEIGWKENNIIDLGDITTARGSEQLLPIWVRLYAAMGSPMFQFKIVK